ncbi:unnamed protein product, partial [Closterium sp. NIES-53]
RLKSQFPRAASLSHTTVPLLVLLLIALALSLCGITCPSPRCPQTNSLWLKYLAEMLQTGKKIRFKANEKRAIIQFKERMAACHSAQAALDDELFNDLWRS